MTAETDGLPGDAKSAIRNRYNRFAAAYSKRPAQGDTRAREYFRARKLAEALRLGSFPAGGYLLEVGCNMGQFTFPLADRGYQILGLDLSLGAIAVAQERAVRLGPANISFAVGDVEAMTSVPDDHFDGVVSFSTLRYTTDLAQALSELYRVVKPGACIVADFPNRLCPWFYLKPWLGSERHPHDHWFTVRNLKMQFEACGFRDVRSKTFLFTPTVTPDRLLSLFQMMDSTCERVPLLKSCGGIIMITGFKV